MRIAVDAMGGDYAPAVVVEGAVAAARAYSQVERLILVGDETAIRAELVKHGPTPDSIQILHADEVVGMDESPAVAIRKKKRSSIGLSIDLVKQGEAQAVFSAGNTGAAVAATTLKLRTLEGVERPAIATVIPTQADPFVLLDAGANPDCTPQMFAQFAVMGSVYAREILGVQNPSVGLLSIGEEDVKGNQSTKEAFRILEASGLNFIGNVESRDLFEGRVSVAVCDGFVGNVVLKTSEAVARAMGRWLKTEFTRNPIRMLGALLLRGGLKALKNKADPATYGGAPLLGVNGICIIGHGSSSAIAVKNGIRVAAEAIAHDVNGRIRGRLQETHLNA